MSKFRYMNIEAIKKDRDEGKKIPTVTEAALIEIAAQLNRIGDELQRLRK